MGGCSGCNSQDGRLLKVRINNVNTLCNQSIGYDIEVTKRGPDQGADLFAERFCGLLLPDRSLEVSLILPMSWS